MLAQDRRVRRTQEALARALIALTLESGYEPVTIRDITARAGVGYATFFRHYRDKDELLAGVLDEVLDELTELLSFDNPAGDQASLGVLLFRYVAENSELVRVLLGSSAVVKRLIASVTGQIMAQQGASGASRSPPEIAAHHIVSASIGMIDWWLQHGMPYPPEQMGLIYRDLILVPANAAAWPQPA